MRKHKTHQEYIESLGGPLDIDAFLADADRKAKKVKAKDIIDQSGVSESNLARLTGWIKAHDAAMITAFRGEQRHCTHDCYTDNWPRGKEFSLEENSQRNYELQSILNKAGFGVTDVDGSYIEGYGSDSPKEVRENSFFVVNLTDTPKFSKIIQVLGERYCQDSVLIMPKGKEAYLLGTNHSPYPGYGKKATKPYFKPGKEAEFMSRIRGRPFHFIESLQIFANIGNAGKAHASRIATPVMEELGIEVGWLDQLKRDKKRIARI